MAIATMARSGKDTTTIQVLKSTAERMSSLRSLGLTYDDVINLALDAMPPEEIRRLFSQWQAEAFAKIRADPRVRVLRPSRRKR